MFDAVADGFLSLTLLRELVRSETTAACVLDLSDAVLLRSWLLKVTRVDGDLSSLKVQLRHYSRTFAAISAICFRLVPLVAHACGSCTLPGP